MPAMSDSPLRGYDGRHEWFWEPGDEKHIFPLDRLMDMYEKSVGRNSTLILGVTPDAEGRIPVADSLRMAEFGKEIELKYGNPLKRVSGKGRLYKVKFDKPVEVTYLVMQEDICGGERVRKYSVEGKVDGHWKVLAEGSCIGHKRIELLEQGISVKEIRLKIEACREEPLIKNFAVYGTPE